LEENEKKRKGLLKKLEQISANENILQELQEVINDPATKQKVFEKLMQKYKEILIEMELLLKERKEALESLKKILDDPEKMKTLSSKSSERANVTLIITIVFLKDKQRF
jgi:hypothetical protein